MGDLYTSQVHLKRLLAGQATPAFTPAPENIAKVFDPEFFPGMGALTEDELGRVRCPVRECGDYFHNLAGHLRTKHRGLGSVEDIKAALGFPKTQAFSTETVRKGQRRGAGRPFGKVDKRRCAPEVRKKGGRISTHARNHADSCPAQLQARIASLAEELGHSPSMSEFAHKHGSATLNAVKDVFGSWNNAKALLGLVAIGRDSCAYGTDEVCESLRTWFECHGDMPSYSDVADPQRAPMIPSHKAIQRAFQTKSWNAAMRSAVERLGVRSERYSYLLPVAI